MRWREPRCGQTKVLRFSQQGCTERASPAKHITKKVVVYCLQVCGIESTFNRLLYKLIVTGSRVECFEGGQLLSIVETAKILKDVRSGIQIRVRSVAHSDHRLPCGTLQS